MNRARVAFVCAVALYFSLASIASAAILEVPANGGDASGIGYFSGWKCPPNDNITIVIDGGAVPLPVPSGVRRGDTAGVCGNDGRNGYISQFNFNLLGDGNHLASVRRNGVQFAQAIFHVSTFGTTFLSGASGTYQLLNFPNAGQTATIEWSEGAQNFIIVGTSGGASARVRYRNELTCDDFDFTSTLSANGFNWVSFTDTNSAYQNVNRTSLGPFLQTSTTPCGNITYSFTLPITAGRSYILVQSFEGGGPFLSIFDEGPAMMAADLADGTAGTAVEEGPPTLVATVPGFVAEAAGTLGPAPSGQ